MAVCPNGLGNSLQNCVCRFESGRRFETKLKIRWVQHQSCQIDIRYERDARWNIWEYRKDIYFNFVSYAFIAQRTEHLVPIQGCRGFESI